MLKLFCLSWLVVVVVKLVWLVELEICIVIFFGEVVVICWCWILLVRFVCGVFLVVVGGVDGVLFRCWVLWLFFRGSGLLLMMVVKSVFMLEVCGGLLLFWLVILVGMVMNVMCLVVICCNDWLSLIRFLVLMLFM